MTGPLDPPPGPRAGEPLRVLIVAAYPAVRAGLGALLARDAGLRPVEAPAGPALAWTGEPEAAPAAIVLDPAGLAEGVPDDLAEAYPGVPLVLLGADPATDGPGLGERPVAYLAPDADAPSLAAAVRGVVAGLTILDPSVVAAAGIHAHGALGRGAEALPGEVLTGRERQVLELVAAGLPNKAIARELGISEHTAKFHVGSLLAKLGAGSRTEAVTLATRRGLLTV
jgi:two-component system nitrate/nitrite response regulator NarL